MAEGAPHICCDMRVTNQHWDEPSRDPRVSTALTSNTLVRDAGRLGYEAGEARRVTCAHMRRHHAATAAAAEGTWSMSFLWRPRVTTLQCPNGIDQFPTQPTRLSTIAATHELPTREHHVCPAVIIHGRHSSGRGCRRCGRRHVQQLHCQVVRLSDARYGADVHGPCKGNERKLQQNAMG